MQNPENDIGVGRDIIHLPFKSPHSMKAKLLMTHHIYIYIYIIFIN